MTSFSLLEQDIENCVDLPGNCLKNTLIVSQSIQLAQNVNLNKAKGFVAQVRGNINITVGHPRKDINYPPWAKSLYFND